HRRAGRHGELRRCRRRWLHHRHHRGAGRPAAGRAARPDRHLADLHPDPAAEADRPVREQGVSRQAVLCAIGLAAAVIYPLLAPNYLINVGMMVFFVAFIGQSWNIAGGFAGQTSFGHVVFFGTGAYTSTILQVTYGWNPWLAWPAAMLAGGIVGWIIAFLSFRAGLRGSYFALITLAFAEVFRILANSVSFRRGGLGMLIKADQRPINFQFKDPIWIYYIA